MPLCFRCTGSGGIMPVATHTIQNPLTGKPMMFQPTLGGSIVSPTPLQIKERTGHGRRGRPLGSVGRRKLLENNRENLKKELKDQLSQSVSGEREAKVELIKRKLQVSSQAGRIYNI
eukprot:sb/3476536/